MIEISKIFLFTGLICSCVLSYFAEDVLVTIFIVLFLWFPLNIRQNVPLATLPHSQPSKIFQQFLSCENPLIPTRVLFLNKDFSMIIIFLPTISSLMMWSMVTDERIYLPIKDFPSLYFILFFSEYMLISHKVLLKGFPPWMYHTLLLCVFCDIDVIDHWKHYHIQDRKSVV